MILLAVFDAGGLAFVMEDYGPQAISDCRLIRVLEHWCPPFSGYHLCDPSRYQPLAAFKLVLETLRYRS
jgi:hypothetical protein